MKIQNKINSILGLFTLFGAILSAFIYVNHQKAGLIAFGVLLAILLFSLIRSRKIAFEKRAELRAVMSKTDTATNLAISRLPVPILLLDAKGKISYYNTGAKALFQNPETGTTEILGKNISEFVKNVKFEELAEGIFDEDISINGKVYNIFLSMVNPKVAEGENASAEDGEPVASTNSEKKKNLKNINDKKNSKDEKEAKSSRKDEALGEKIIYFFDVTDYAELKEIHQNTRPVVFHVHVDNLDEVSKGVNEESLPFIRSEIEKVILHFGARHLSLVKRLSAGKYIVVSDYAELAKIESLKFPILDDAREIDEGNKIPITLSIGVGYQSDNLQALEAEAFSCLEIALGRGGDQAVLKRAGSYEYYGGKSIAVEKRNRVKARVIAHGLKSMIEESSEVFAMGHRMPDMDSFGSAVGVFRAARLLGAKAHVVVSEITPAIQSVYDTFKDIEEYSFITGEEAVQMASEKSLLVVVDTHKQSIVDHAPLVDAVDNIAIIDHHRRGAEFIDKALLKYVEPYSSSASELVTEVIQYIADKPTLLSEEADALLAGITVDTKNFSLRTGVRTFEAASFLRRKSADPIKVRQLFQDDLEVFRLKAEIVSSAERYHGDIAVATIDDDNDQIQIIAAQAANDLLDIKGINGSFVIAKKKSGMVLISGRSLGEVNVQIVLEMIGGGGHLEVAGAQFEGKEIPEVKEMLLGAIDRYYEEESES